MAITITVDNDRTTMPFDPLLLDETAGVQTPVSTDDGNEINVTLTAEVAGSLGGFPTAFNTFLNGATLGLTDAQKIYARDHDGALSASNFVLVTTTAGETINDLFFANASGGMLAGVQVAGMTTLDGQNVFLWSNGNFGSSSDFCVATTSNVAGAGEVVAAFYLNEAADHKSAQVLMVVFEPLEHNNNGLDPDDALNFTDALRVGASGSLSFDFDQLASQSSLWVAVGNANEAVLISGVNPDVNNTTGKKTNASDVIHTSQGGQDATIGVNNQLFDNVGETAVFTLVTGLQGLVGADAGVLSDHVINDPTSPGVEQGIAYSGYIPGVTGAGVFISQDQGSPSATKSLDINVFKTNNASEEEGFGYVYSDGTAKTGDALTDDTAVNVTTVTVRNAANAIVAVWSVSPSGTQVASGTTVAGVQVTINGNNIDVNNFGVEYTISWTTAEAFNRFNVVNEAGAWDVGRVDVDRTIPSTTSIGDKLFVEDDAPTPGTPVLKHVDEDAMTGVLGDDLSTGHVEAPADADGIAGEQDEVTFSQADLAATVSSGTDSPAVFSLNASLANGTAVTTVGGANVFSQGDQVFYRTVSGVIQGVTDAGTASERIIFTITRNDSGVIGDPSDDTFTFDLRDQLDHANASGELSLVNLNLTPAFSAKDADNDPVNFGTSALIRVEVENDTPRPDGDFVRKHVDEDAMTGAAGSDLSTGHVEAPADADGIPGEQDEISFNQADLQGVVTNGADEPVLFSLNLSLANGTAVKAIGGADVFSKGQQVFWNVNGNVIEGVAGSGGSARVVFTITRIDSGVIGDPSDDTFTFDLTDQLDHANGSGELSLVDLNVTPAFRASDFDGDAVDFTGSEAIRVEVENDTPRPDGDFVSKHVDEDAMTGAATSDLSTGHVEAPADADGILGEQDEISFNQTDLQGVVTNGADEPVFFSLSATLANGTAVTTTSGANVFSKGDQVSYRTVSGVIQGVTDAGTADERIIFTITRNDNALIGDPSDDTFTFDLRDQLDHANGSGELSLVDLNVTPAFRASDFDGDAVDFTGSNAIRVEVENDTPRPDGDFVNKHVDEDAMTGAATSDLSTGHVEAPADADGILGEQDEISFNQADLQGVVTNGSDEPVFFSLSATLANGTAVTTTSGANVFSKGDQVSYRTVSGVIQGVTDAGTADERIIFTITRNDNALIGDPSDDTFTFDLRDQLDHANGSGELSLVNLNVTPAFRASDFDGDAVDFTGSNAIRVEVENDTPRPDGDTISEEVHEDALTGGNTPDAGDSETKVVTVTYSKAELNSLANIGADEDLTFSLNTAASGAAGAIIGTNVVTTGGAAVLSKGLNVVWAAGDTPGSLKGVVGTTTIFTLTPSGDDFVLTLVDQVDHSGAENDLELLPIDLTSAFKAVDFDLDPLTLNPDSVVLNVENDLPIFTGQILSKTLDWVDDGFVTGSLFGKAGGDEPASYTIDKYTDLAGYTETLSTDGKTLTYSIAGTTYFTLQLNDAANSGAGSYTFTVNEPPPQQILELNFQDLASGQNLFGTVAFNKANINNNGTPGDSTDDFLPDGGLMTFASNLDINDGEDGEPGPPAMESNDGTFTSQSGTTNTSKGGGPVTIGNSNQAFDNPAEGAWFVYVDNPVTTAVSGVGLDANLADDADNMKFDGTVEVNKASVEIVQASGKGTASSPGPAMQITAYDINPGKVDTSAESRAFALDPTATGDQANIIGCKIYDANGVLIEYRTNEDNGTTNDGDLQNIPGADESAVVISFVLDDNGGTPADPTDDIYSVLVSNLKANYTIEWETEGDHDAAQVQHVSGSYDIGGFNLLQGQDTPDVDFEFSVAIQDKDGDLNNFNGTSQTFDDFKIKVDGTGTFNDPANVAPIPFATSYDFV